MTLLDDERVSVSADLSGGLDSRTVLAFLLSTGEFDTRRKRFRLASSRDKQDDLRAASTIADHYGLELNGHQATAGSPRDDAGSMGHWERNSLGVYLPLYLNNQTFNAFQFQAHGAGGGNFRPHFKDSSIEDRINRYKRRIDSDEHSRWLDTTLSDMETLQRWRPLTPIMVLHYREFRNRFHFGHNPHRRAMLTPLNSSMTDQLTDGPTGVSARQFYFDTMESLSPGLKDLPYDSPEKSPDDDVRRSITRAEVADLAPGRIYGTSPGHQVTSHHAQSSPYAAWLEAAGRATTNADVREFLGPDASIRCDEALTQVARAERPLGSHHRATLDLSHALLVEFALGQRPAL
ncbi:asparagine synthase-related protein [Actinocorallia glomerata]